MTHKGVTKMAKCPQCPFEGTEAEVDEHRATGVHNDEPQAGGNRRR